MHSEPGKYLFEEKTHWWLTQISCLADEWLDDLFGERRAYGVADFAELYRTNLNILGQPLDDNVQECATLARLIYGLSSAYLLTGKERYLDAAQAGVKYQRETFRSLSHDGEYCLWNFGKRRRATGAQIIVASENPDDRDTIPLYEQIYALAGLAQYYRATQDWETLEDIQRTVAAFQKFYLDRGADGGYFSHIDYATMEADAESLGDNRSRKNWNSIGDHIPAYLVNLILALDPPPSGPDHEEAERLLRTCRTILDTTSRLILEKFPDPEGIPYVNERFFSNWEPDHNWRWQKNRAIVGHNLKIAWNLTRVASYYRTLASRVRAGEEVGRAEEHERYAGRLLDLARKLGDEMVAHGLDQVRGGCFDAVERKPRNGLPIEFSWGNTKDFWQQEQGILAYLILHGATDDTAGHADYLALAREMMAFWNQFFLDHDARGIWFRVTESGEPVVAGTYAQKAGHAVAGYHAFELNYLAHIYIRSFVERDNFSLFFRPDKASARNRINVLPDFFAPDALEIVSITVNGIRRKSLPKDFSVELDEEDLGGQIIVEYRPKERCQS
jgi:mannose/cellobiose epimerase-like protein (N-acyl-D-glucosamine 2-epimerase family)